MKRHWPVGAEVSEAAFEGGRMLYDTQRTSNFSPEFFEPEYWRKHDAIEGTARGRGTTWFIRTGDSSFVLRHYRRGGLMAKISKDRYWWHGEIGDALLRRVVSHLSPASRGSAGAHAHRGALSAPGPVLSRRPHHPAHREQRAAGGAAAEGAAVVHAVDRRRPLHPALSRRRRVSCGSQRAQHPADARAGVHHRLRSRRAAQARLVGGLRRWYGCIAHSRR